MGNFGASLLVVNDEDPLSQDEERSMLGRLVDVAAEPVGKFLYFHPRVYRLVLGTNSDLPTFRLPDGQIGRALIIPERHTLWFARGAVLSLAPGFVLIIRGSIRADPRQIFDLPEIAARRDDRRATDLAGRALVRFESTRIEEIYPEWFGAVASFASPSAADASVNAAAYQACLHAAVRDRTRDGVSLPPLTVVSRGVFSMNETLEVSPDVNGRGALWMAGNGDATRRGMDVPSLNRFPRGATQFAREPNGEEDERSALLRLDPRVSAEISGVGFRCFEFQSGSLTTRDVAHALLVEEGTTTVADPILFARHVHLDRCGLTGGREAVVALKPQRAAPSGATPGSHGQYPRAPVLRSAARVSMESCVLDAVLADGGGAGGLAPVRTRSARRIVHLESIDTSMFELTASLVFQTKSAYFNSAGAVFNDVDLEAGVWVKGVPTLVRAVSFHLGEGPRPSRVAPSDGAPETADGQDLWLASSEDGAAPHVTVLHADTQSWWHLGADPIRRRRPGAVCLLNVGGGDVNLRDLEGASLRLESTTGMRFRRPLDDSLEAQRLFTPPSVWWPDSVLPLLMVGCAFKRYAVRQSEQALVMNVGSCFTTVLDASLSTWLSPRAVPRPFPGDLLAGIRDGRIIPADERLGSPLAAQSLPVLASE